MLGALHLCSIRQTPDEFSYKAAEILSLERISFMVICTFLQENNSIHHVYCQTERMFT